MKKIVMALGLALLINGAAYADGNAFTPLNFNDTAYKTNTSTTYSSNQSAKVSSETEAVGNGNIQNAISELENGQVVIRNDLLNCKTKYADVDAQYKLVKAERAALKKETKAIEKRIKELDRAKEKIRRNML